VGDKKNKRRFRLISCLPLTEPALDFRGLRRPAGMEYRIPKLATAVQLAPLFTRDAGGMALTARW